MHAMKSGAAVLLSALALFGCASAPKPAATPVAPPAAEAHEETPAPEVEAPAEPPAQSAAEAWAERRSRAEEASAPPTADATASDPLAVDAAMQSATTANVQLTNPRELRRNAPRDLMDGRRIAEKAVSFEEAVQKVRTRLGKATWIEGGHKHVWVVKEGAQCYRLLLDSDGSVETDTATLTEWKTLSALSQQNACTGETKNGMPGINSQ